MSSIAKNLTPHYLQFDEWVATRPSCVVDRRAIPTKVILNAYKEWCVATGKTSYSDIAIGRVVAERFPNIKVVQFSINGSRVRHYVNDMAFASYDFEGLL